MNLFDKIPFILVHKKQLFSLKYFMMISQIFSKKEIKKDRYLNGIFPMAIFLYKKLGNKYFLIKLIMIQKMI